jgi:hypothetical protein
MRETDVNPAPLITVTLTAALLSFDGHPADRPNTDTLQAIVVQNYYYARPGKAEEVYRWRLHASDVRASLGLSRGRVLLPDHRQDAGPDSKPSKDAPDVIWECDYPSRAAREADLKRLEASHTFDAVEKHMDTLIRDFRRVIFAVRD